MKTLLALILLAWGSLAQAVDLSWSWTPPTARTDGTPFDMTTEGAGYRVWLNGSLQSSLAIPGSTQYVYTIQQAGPVCIELATVDVDGLESTRTAPVCKTVNAPPNMPTSITVTVIIGGTP